MYKLINGQLLQFTEVVTTKQTALVTTTVATVIGHSVGDETIEFNTIPIREDREGFNAELHYTDGQLVWVYTPMETTESRVGKLESETETIKLALAELVELITGKDTD